MMKRIRTTAALAAAVLAAAVPFTRATVPAELEQEARDAMDRGAAWLAARQQENGAWGMPDRKSVV